MLKFFGIVGLVGTVVVFYLVTYGVGPERQLPPSVSLLEGFRADGYVPENVNLAEDKRAEDAGVFKVPAQDAVVLEAATAAMGDMNMGGMDMSGSGSADMGNTAMAGGDSATMGGMDMSGGGSTDMAGMDMSGNGGAVLDMDMNGDGVMDMSSADMGNTAMAGGDSATMGGMDMSGSGSTDMAGMGASSGMPMAEGGLAFSEDGAFDRVIELDMTEWSYSKMQIDVKMGERIKFVVTNKGQIPHEFMFMNMPLMAAANYRGTRADWNLLEHEALFEQSMILPGGSFEFVVDVQQNGAWMFMCMLPYHMQMGMMGQMSTEGMAMEM